MELSITTVVDSHGYPVKNYNGPVSVYTSGGDLSLLKSVGSSTTVSNSSSSPASYTATNGQVVIPVQSNNTTGGGNVDQVNVGIPNVSGSSATQKIDMVAQKSTYVQFVKAPSYTSNTGSATFNLVVSDQNHVAMTSGAYTGKVTLSGHGTLGSTGGSQVTSEYVGLSPAGSVTVSPLYSGATGSFTLTPSVSGLKGEPTTAQFVAPGTATQFVNTTSSSVGTSFTADTAAGSSFATYTVQPEDVNNLPVSVKTAPTAKVIMNGMTAKDMTASVSSASNGAYNVALSGSGTIKAGTYDVVVSGDNLPSMTIPVTITAGVAAKISVSPSASYYDVLNSSPTTMVTAQVTDQFGNPVSTKDIPITFAANSTSDETLSGGTGSSGTRTVNTNSSGQASVNADILANGGSITASGPSGSSLTSASTGTFNLVSSYATAVQAKVQSYASGQSAFTAGAAPTVSFSALDSSGNAAYANDQIQYTVTGPNGYSSTHTVASGTQVTLPAVDAVGTYTVKATDISVPSHPSTTQTFAVQAGTLNGFALFNGSSNLDLSSTADSVAAGQTGTVTVKPVDSVGNPVSSDAYYTVTLPTPTTGSQWETTSGVPISTVHFTPGQSSQTVMLANGSSSAVNIPTSSAPSGANTTQTITATGTTVTANQSTAVTLTAKDKAGNPLANESLMVSVPSGDGTLNTKTVQTNSNGQAVVTYSAPKTAATYDLSVTPGVLGAKQTVKLNVVAGPISATQSTAPGSGSLTASKSTGHAMTFTFLDAYGNPVANKSVSFSHSGFSSGALFGSTSSVSHASAANVSGVTTNSKGQATIYVSDTKAGDTGTVSAAAEGVTVTSGTQTIVPAALANYTVTKNSAGNIVVTAYDKYGNVQTGTTSAYVNYTATEPSSGTSDALVAGKLVTSSTSTTINANGSTKAITLTKGTATLTYTPSSESGTADKDVTDTIVAQNASSSSSSTVKTATPFVNKGL